MVALYGCYFLYLTQMKNAIVGGAIEIGNDKPYLLQYLLANGFNPI